MSDTEQQILLSRQLLAGGFHAILSTTSEKHEGYPFGSLVPYCLDKNDHPILLLSHLSEHTKNLHADPKCAFTITEPGQGDVQQLARLTGMADAEPVAESEEEEIAERYLRYFPSGRPYYEQLNFHFYRLKPVRFYLVGGFGAARWFGIDRILRAESLSPGKESELLVELNAKRSVLAKTINPSNKEVTAVGIDPDGIDLLVGEQLIRLSVDQGISEDTNTTTLLNQIAPDK